jgi:phosphate transport system substrate-binding protein
MPRWVYTLIVAMVCIGIGVGIGFGAWGGGKEAQAETWTVINRDPESGTRGTFEDLVMGDTEISTNSEQYGSNQAVLAAIASIDNGIGYVSLGYLPYEGVKAIELEGVYPSIETVLDGTYPISRTLYFVTKGNVNDDATMDKREAKAAFIYWCQNDGQNYVLDQGYIPLPEDYVWKQTEVQPKLGHEDEALGGWASGNLTEGGSTTVLPLAEIWSQEYEDVTRGVVVTTTGGGSGDGAKQCCNGNYDIGAMSRDPKDSEKDMCLSSPRPLVQYDLALDAVAIVVSDHVYNDLGVTSLTVEQVRTIFALGSDAKIPVIAADIGNFVAYLGPSQEVGTIRGHYHIN